MSYFLNQFNHLVVELLVAYLPIVVCVHILHDLPPDLIVIVFCYMIFEA